MSIQEIIKRLRYKAENITAKLEPEYFSECADYLEGHLASTETLLRLQNKVIDMQDRTINLLEEKNELLKGLLKKAGVDIEDDRK